MRHSLQQTSILRASMIHRALRVVHRTRARWMLTAVVATVGLIWTIGTVHEAESAARAWGQRRSVAVAVGDLEPGRIITDDDIVFTDRPLALLPDGIVEAPVGRTVIRTIRRNEVVLDVRLAANGTGGPGSLLESDEIAFAIPTEATTPRVRVGDDVVLFAPSEVITSAGRSAGPASRVAERAVVVEVTERSVMVGVDRAEAGAVARALLSATIVIALED